MLKPAARLLCIALLASATFAGAQDAQVVVCENGDVDRCYPIGTDPGVAQPGYTHPTDQSQSTWSHDGMTLSPPPPTLDTLPAAPLEPIQAWLEWKPASVSEDPLYRRADGCSYTPARARGRFARAAMEQDLNALLTAYQWRGKTDAQATPIIDRLSQIGAHGSWESSTVGMWTGPAGVEAKVPTHWRWAWDGQVAYLAMRKIDDCWFVEFAANPGDMVEIPIDKMRRTQAEPQDTPQPPRVDPNNPNVLVF